MNDLLERVRTANAGLDWPADRQHAATIQRSIEARLTRRARARRAATGVAVLAAIALPLWMLLGAPAPVALDVQRPEGTPPATAPVEPAPSTLPRWTFSDGSTARALTESARVTTQADSNEGTRLRLESGAAEFVVAPRGARPFIVESGRFEVRVVGTRFVLTPLDGGGLRVAVTEGTVEVSGAGKKLRLGAGETHELSPEDERAASPEVEPETTPAPSAPRAAAQGWRTLAGAKDYRGAYEAMRREEGGAVRDEAADRLLAADVARLSGHPADAIPHLNAVVTRFSSDARAASAAFTLGRVYEGLGRARDAAVAFARALSLAPGGPLAEDALAHEVENLAKSGLAEQARRRAEQYLRLYPSGHRVRSVRAHAGLE